MRKQWAVWVVGVLTVGCSSDQRDYGSSTTGGAGGGGASSDGGTRAGSAGTASSGAAGSSNGSGGDGNGGSTNTEAGTGGTVGGSAPGEAGAAGDDPMGEGGEAGQPSTPMCGNGKKDAGEACDNGAENGLELLRCAPDCSRVIVAKHIKLGNEVSNGRLQPNPVAIADATCPVGYKALFAFGAVRRATTSANKVSNPIDWVIQPYTQYVATTENPLWLTDSVALLGVRNGAFVGLENAVDGATQVMLTGMKADWTTLGTDNCNGWSASQGDGKHYGFALSKTIGFLYDDATITCEGVASFYCVEQ